jgi:hypothetical protein
VSDPSLELICTRSDRDLIGICYRPDQETLDRAAARIATAEQARRVDPRVVDDQQITRAQEPRQPRDVGVRQRSARAIDHQQASGAANGRRLLGDQFRGKVEVEVADVHVRNPC